MDHYRSESLRALILDHLGKAGAAPDQVEFLFDRESQAAFLARYNDVRQVVHVTFGSALAAFRPRLLEGLRAHEEEYAAVLAAHFARHLQPLIQPVSDAAPARS